MTQLKFDGNGIFIPQRVNYKLTKDEEKEEMIDKYVKKKTNYQINYDHEGNAIFVKKGNEKLEEMKIESI